MKKRIAVAQPVFGGKEKEYVMECLESGWISSIGSFIGEFEERFASYCGSAHGIATNNGTTALHLALAAAGVRPGDEVIVPTLTYIASANAVRYCGAIPVFVDSEPRTMNMDPDLIAAKITPRTKAIIAVHLYGHPVDMDPVLELAGRHGLLVIEDAAESHGAEYKGRRTGSLGTAATFSFYGNKTVTTGEGGMVTTSDSALGERLRLLRGQGMDPARRYWFNEVGFNYRMTNVAAAIGLAQMEQLEGFLRRRVAIAAGYTQLLRPLDGVMVLPCEQPWARHSHWSYAIVLRKSAGPDRDCLMKLLEADGIETRPVFYPMHQMPPYAEPEGRYPVADELSRRGICLPMHAALTDDDIEYIAASLKARLRPAYTASA
jgi:perosamine synthetase